MGAGGRGGGHGGGGGHGRGGGGRGGRGGGFFGPRRGFGRGGPGLGFCCCFGPWFCPCCHHGGRHGAPPAWLCLCTLLGITACCCPSGPAVQGANITDEEASSMGADTETMGRANEGDALINRGPRMVNVNEYKLGEPSKKYKLEIPTDSYPNEVLQIELDERMFTVTVPEGAIGGEKVVVIAPAPSNVA